MKTSGVFGTREHLPCQTVFKNKACYAFKQAHLPEPIFSEILDLPGSFFFRNIGNLMLILKIREKCRKRIMFFFDNLISIGLGKFSLFL